MRWRKMDNLTVAQTISSVVVAERTYGDFHTDLERRGQPIGPLDIISCRTCTQFERGAGDQ